MYTYISTLVSPTVAVPISHSLPLSRTHVHAHSLSLSTCLQLGRARLREPCCSCCSCSCRDRHRRNKSHGPVWAPSSSVFRGSLRFWDVEYVWACAERCACVGIGREGGGGGGAEKWREYVWPADPICEKHVCRHAHILILSVMHAFTPTHSTFRSWGPLQHSAQHCTTLQHTATHWSQLNPALKSPPLGGDCDTLVLHCNTLHGTARPCKTVQDSATQYNPVQPSATQCSTVQHSATQDTLHSVTLLDTVRHC